MASAIDTARAGIEGRLNTNWSTTAIAWPGHEGDMGADDWIRATLRFGPGQMESYSATGVNTINGLLIVDLFTLSRAGLGTLYGYVDTLRDLFDRVTVGAVEFLAASGPREIDSRDSAGEQVVWQQLQVEFPFILEENS